MTLLWRVSLSHLEPGNRSLDQIEPVQQAPGDQRSERTERGCLGAAVDQVQQGAVRADEGIEVTHG